MVPWRRDWRVYISVAVLVVVALGTAVVVSIARDRHDAVVALAYERQQERVLVGEVEALKRDAAAQASALNYLTRELTALRRQVRRLGGNPVDVGRAPVATARPEPTRTASPKPSPSPTRSRRPSPTPTACPPLPTCLPIGAA